MCGIFGLIANNSSGISQSKTAVIIKKLFILSESRGKESAGIAIKNTTNKKIYVVKHSIPASELVKSNEYNFVFHESTKTAFGDYNKLQFPISVIAHTRLVTNGSMENNNNNQPVIKNNYVAVHNGIITNADELWNKYPRLNREFEVDTEVFIAIIDHYIAQEKSIIDAVQLTFQEVKGTASTALLFSEYDKVVLASNNASLYYALNQGKGILIFASENYILQKAIYDLDLKQEFGISDSIWSLPFSGILIDLNTFVIDKFNLKEKNNVAFVKKNIKADEIINHSADEPVVFDVIKKHLELLRLSPLRNLLQFNIDDINKLQRCTKCLLPETFPYIIYDDEGVCNYCKSYKRKINLTAEEKKEKLAGLEKIVGQYRKNNEYDVIVPFSGGRDSSYGLHFIRKELGLNPITFTYDWGMVTDLARRNIARVTGKLGIENIVISADIQKNRENIRKNVTAWLKKPELGIIPLFMAGDKQFFYFSNQIKKQTGIRLDIWMANKLENTDFKVGFCGISPDFGKNRIDYLSGKKRIQLLNYYAGCFIKNPSYINASLKDTFLAYWYYYFEPRKDYYLLFDYILWDESTVEKTIMEEYDWELSPDTRSTWRIGDGTAGFYNYIYYTVTGFSEIDTFRSNQIREGMLTREAALQLVNEENKPRYDSIKWYCDTIHIDFETTIKTINRIKKLY